MAAVAEKFGIHTTHDNVELVKQVDVLVLSVKPQILDKVLRQVSSDMREGTIVISIAAFIPALRAATMDPAGALQNG